MTRSGISASVASPLVDWLRRRGIPRGIGAGLVFLAIIAVGIGVGLLVLVGTRARPPEDAFAGEDQAAVLIEMLAGSSRPAVEALARPGD